MHDRIVVPNASRVVNRVHFHRFVSLDDTTCHLHVLVQLLSLQLERKDINIACTFAHQ